MSDFGAYHDEMGFINAIDERDVNRLLAGHIPPGRGAELEQVTDFVRALAAAVPEAPDPAREAGLVARLVEAARAESGKSAPRPVPRRSAPGRLGLALKLGTAAALLPAFLAALAFAGVSLPGPAQDAFDRVGIELPNQAGTKTSSDQSATDEDSKGASESSDERSAKAKAENNPRRHFGLTNRRSHRRALGPSQSPQTNPPGTAIRRGPNPTPETAPGVPELPPQASGNAGDSGQPNPVGQTDGRGKNG